MLTECLTHHWAHIREGLLSTAAGFTEQDLSFVPFEESYSVREILLHIAHEEAIEIHYGLLHEPDEFPAAYAPGDYPTRASIGALLAEVHQRTENHLQSLVDEDMEKEIEAAWGRTHKQIDMLLHVIEHETHHRGELSRILGILGREGLDASFAPRRPTDCRASILGTRSTCHQTHSGVLST